MRLELLDPAWIDDAISNPVDQCAHGRIRLKIGDIAVIDPADGEFTVNAAALHFLRSLDADSTPDLPLAEGCQFVPCCAVALFTSPATQFGFVAMGCPEGIELDITHRGERVRVSRRSSNVFAEVTKSEWAEAVLGFAAQVQCFYDASEPKEEPDPSEQEAWSMFWSEWGRRTGAVLP